MRILTFTSLYPNRERPQHGVFVENRLRHLVHNGGVTARVVAPCPWFPFAGAIFGPYATLARIPRSETRFGIAVDHPRYPTAPMIGMMVGPLTIYWSAKRRLRQLIAEGHEFDLIDAHYFYPDGVAAVLLGKAFGKPVVITARGTDVNFIPRYAAPRFLINFAASNASGIIAVSQALKSALIALGIAPERIEVLRNGVDLELFRPIDRRRVRTAMGLTGPTLLSVGHLIERKGHHLAIGALPELAGYRLLIVGEGPERAALERSANRLRVADRVAFLGPVDHRRLCEVYSAADALVLASSREGWANVLLEAMACGTPVVASYIWGNPEVVSRPEAGVLMRERTPSGVAAAVRRLFADPPSRAATRRYAEGFSWESTTRGQLQLFRRILERNGMGRVA